MSHKKWVRPSFLGMKFWNPGLVVLLVTNIVFFMLWFQVSYAESINKSIPLQQQQIKLVWSADYGQGEQIFYSSYDKNNDWTVPLQLSDSRDSVYLPVVGSGNDGKVWVVWSHKKNKKIFLEWSVYRASKWSLPSQIETGLDSNKAVTIIVDLENRPWIAWSGTEKTYPDIYWSRWDGNGWEKAEKMHGANDVPDLDPSFLLDHNGNIVLSWQTFENRRYITVAKKWDGQQWQTVDPSMVESKMKNKSYGPLAKIIPPRLVQDSSQGSLFIKGPNGAESFSLSDL
jgi:hypothetical protein